MSALKQRNAAGSAIATTIARLSGIGTPTIAVVVGEGGSEAALAFGVADRVLMMENAIYSTISPRVRRSSSIRMKDAPKKSRNR